MGIEVFENYECEGQISLDNIEESENALTIEDMNKIFSDFLENL